MSVYITDLAVLAIFLLAGFGIAFRTCILIQLPVLYIGGLTGFWLFYVLHQFEGVYWSRHGEWDRMKAALEGSSTYKPSPSPPVVHGRYRLSLHSPRAALDPRQPGGPQSCPAFGPPPALGLRLAHTEKASLAKAIVA